MFFPNNGLILNRQSMHLTNFNEKSLLAKHSLINLLFSNSWLEKYW